MEHIGISVIVPIYNTKPYLKECVDSILKQEVEVPFEVLLVDDGATDGCAEMCDEFAAKDKRVRRYLKLLLQVPGLRVYAKMPDPKAAQTQENTPGSFRKFPGFSRSIPEILPAPDNTPRSAKAQAAP